MGTRILVVEDEPGIAEPLVAHLGREGFEAMAVGTVADARETFEHVPPAVVVLDVMLPDGDGRDLCREFRATSNVPIVMLTARGADVDRIVGLELGADDYVVKPFSAGELVARIRAILRRTGLVSGRRVLEVADLRLDVDARTVTKGDIPLTLAAREFDLLALLMGNAGRVLRREEIDGRGLGPSLVRLDQDARRPHRVAPEETRGRPSAPAVHLDDPWRRLQIRRRCSERIGGRHDRSQPARDGFRIRVDHHDRRAHDPARLDARSTSASRIRAREHRSRDDDRAGRGSGESSPAARRDSRPDRPGGRGAGRGPSDRRRSHRCTRRRFARAGVRPTVRHVGEAGDRRRTRRHADVGDPCEPGSRYGHHGDRGADRG